jgi:predicted DCC family thiol-disulfide oxidoreductase YuxK
MGTGVVLYDGDCGFCRWMLARLLAWDRAGAVRPVAIQSSDGQDLLEAISPDVRLASWHFVSADGCLYSGAAAAAPLMRLLPRGEPFGRLAGLSPALSDAAYRLVAQNRTVAGRLLSREAKRRAKRRIDERESQMRSTPLPTEVRPCRQ